MKTMLFITVLALSSGAVQGGQRLEAAQNRAINADALVLVDFKKRVDAYVEIHQKAAKEGPRIGESSEPAEILKAQNALASRIRALRSTARPGDIFTPEIRARFRQLLYPETKGEDGADAKAILKDDAPGGVPMAVNAKYPEGASLPTVPVNMLLNLPPLPQQLEYRIIGKHLILRDTLADIVVDFIPNVIQ